MIKIFKNRLKFAPEMRFILFLLLVLVSLQSGNSQSTDWMNSHGKINVVFAVVFIVFAGIIYFLIRIERKINKLENK